ncbi:uncharacterized protein LOC129951510 [Eupeodes corollae]|uniref:uncharacterized protein LOC129951510 n=1 Tax=Eupeodes corollae TaxID=290404 RepID=UPI00248FBA3F|nr:uncharacterized protein LOC129951510 [Eupeodes corollae]
MRFKAFLVFFFVAFACFGNQVEGKFLNITRILDTFNFSKGVRVQGDCSYNVNGDLTDPQPLFLKHNTTQFLLPNSSGIVDLSNGQLFDMYCSDGFVNPLLNKTKITAKCLQGSFHLVDGIIHDFKDFSCQDWPIYSARRTNRTCNGGTVLIELGFHMGDGNFVQIIDVCHDEINEVNRYAHFKMSPSSQGYQRYVARPPLFITGGFYRGRDVNELYTKVQQKVTLDKILGQNTSKYFNASDIYLARGHLSAKVDHVYGPAQKATFFFVNAAPQWQCFNAGNWESVESSVRKFIAKQGIEVECYTGTWGISSLPDVNGVQQELYLDFDKNNNGLIPVPKLYFRVVVEPATKKGVVLIGVNNPHISMEEIQRDYVICDNVIDNLTWMKWDKNNLFEGYLYACEVQQFRQVVQDLPEFDVTELTLIKTKLKMKFSTALILLAISFADISNARDIQRSSSELIDETLDEPVIPKSRAAPRKEGCNVRVSELGLDAQPLFLTPGASTQWPVSVSGDMELAAGDSLELFCSSTFANPSGISGSQTATCVSGLDFKIGKSTYNISEVTCSSWPSFTTRETGEKCNGGEIYETGFTVGTRFVKQLEICFNEAEEATRYVFHTLSPENMGFQSNVGRPTFAKGGLFGRKNIDKLYTQSSQTKNLAKALGDKGSEYIKAKENLYLARGHMAAKADFITANEQRGTFLFSNVAPQWQAFNAGNWQRVEDNTRNWVAKRNLRVNCWTGIYGITTLPNEDGVETPLYLDYDKNNNGLIPVPKLFYRVIIEPSTKRGLVLLGVNNPYLTMEQIKKDYIVCKDVSDKLDFLTWKKEDLKAGYSYACEVKDFAKVNPNMPKFDVKSLLY